jgi:hypothetical protein
MRGIGNLSCIVTRFHLRKSTQKRIPPSGFGNNNIGDDHGLCDGLIMFAASIF